MKLTAVFFVAGGDGPPLLEPGPQPLDDVAVGVDPLRTGKRCLVGLGRDRWPCTGSPDRLAEAMTGVAAVTHHPLRHARKLIEQRKGVGQFVRLTGHDAERDGASSPVGDHAGLGAIAATRAAKSFTIVSGSSDNRP